MSAVNTTIPSPAAKPTASDAVPPSVAPATGSAPVHAHKPRRAQHIPALDGVRGLAIILVLIFHFAGLGYSQLPPVFQKLFGAGWVGVDLFFVLSGFLITSILVEAKGSAGYFKNFYMRRVLRIFPLYYGVLAVALVLLTVYRPNLKADYLAVANHQWALWLYLQNFVAMDWHGFGHFWSLAVEEHFYMVWPAVVFLLSRRGAIGFCVLLIVSAIGVRVWRELNVPLDADAAKLWRESTYTWTICRMDALAIGSLLALSAHGGAGGIERFRKAAPWVLAAAVLAVGGLFARYGTLNYQMPAIQLAGFTVNAIGSAALLVIAVTAAPKGLVERAFSVSPLRFLGKYSYGTYVFHMFVMVLMRIYVPIQDLKPRVGNSGLAAVAVYIVGGTLISLGVALVSWHLYEKHFLKLKRFFEYRKPTLEGFKANEAVR